MTSLLIASLFRDSASRGHLKRYKKQIHDASIVWPGRINLSMVEGDSVDNTLDELLDWGQERASLGGRQSILHCDTNTPYHGSVVNPERFAILSRLANLAVDAYDGEDYFMWMESDIIWWPDLPLILMKAHQSLGLEAQAPMTLIQGTTRFYDVWAFRYGNEQINPQPNPYGPGCFAWDYPYHPVYDENKPFSLDSAGTCLFVSRKVMETQPKFGVQEAIVDFTRDIAERGFQLWGNPKACVWHPTR